MSKTTPLFELHKAMGARLTDFGGYQMPVNYGSQIDEHHAVRSGAGIFDVSHMGVIELKGSDSAAFLGYALSNDVARLQRPGAGQYSLLLNESGGVLDDLILYRLHSDHYILVVNCANKEGDFKALQRRAAGFNVRLAARPDLGIIALQGPNAAETLAQLHSDSWMEAARLQRFHMVTVQGCFVGRTGYTGEDGFEIICPHDQLETLWTALNSLGATACGLGARDTLRLEAGYCLWGHEMSATVNPYAAGIGWAVRMQPETRDFVGRSALASLLDGGGAPQAMFGLVLQERGVMRDGCVVEGELGTGTVTSGSFSPTLEASIGLARLPKETAIGSRVEVLIRNRRLAALVSKPAFVANGQSLL